MPAVCTDVVAVLGVCRPERNRVAASSRSLTWQVKCRSRTDLLDGIVDVVGQVAGSPEKRVVVNLPSATEADDLIAVIRCYEEPDPSVRLSAIVTVVDAVHLQDDLNRRDYADPGRSEHYRAPWAHIAVTGIEHASHLVVANWQVVSSERLNVVLSLLNHLNPQARLSLHHPRRLLDDILPAAPAPPTKPGWVRVVDGEYEPHMADQRVVAFRYEQMRPFHTARLVHALRDSFGQPRLLMRSAGLCRLATRPGIVGTWSQVGAMVSLDPLIRSTDAPPLSTGSELAFIGVDIQEDALRLALDGCALTDDEFSAGPEYWARIPDRLPAWSTVST